MSLKKHLQKHNFTYFISNLFSHNKISNGVKKTFEIGKFVSLKRCNVFGLSHNKIIIGEHSTLHNVSICIKGNNNIIRICENNEITDSEIVIVGNNCLIEIGKKCSIHNSRLYCGDYDKSLKIGDDCLIGFGTTIMTYDAHSIFNINGEKINQAGNILICNHVWLASNVTVLCGAVINENSVGGAGSFLKNKTIPSGSIFVGNGRIIKTNINWDR